jgi:hypothetical protein
MAQKQVKKVVSTPDTIGGLSLSRYGSLEAASGTISADAIQEGDILKFEIPIGKLVFAKFYAGETVLELNPASDLETPLGFAPDGEDIAYVVFYERGSAKQLALEIVPVE